MMFLREESGFLAMSGLYNAENSKISLLPGFVNTSLRIQGFFPWPIILSGH